MALKDMPIGTVIMWKNTTIPANWAVCDGVHPDVPNIVGRLIMGASINTDLRVTGGSTQHKHTCPNTAVEPDHNHGGTMTLTINGGGGGQWTTLGNPGGVIFGVAGSHNHGSVSGVMVGAGGSHFHTVPDTEYADNMPRRIKRVFIRKIA